MNKLSKILALLLTLALLPLAYAQKTTNVSVLYGWNGTAFVPLLTDATGKLLTDVNISQALDIVPKQNNTFSLGSATTSWLNGYFINLFTRTLRVNTTGTGQTGEFIGVLNVTGDIYVSGDVIGSPGTGGGGVSGVGWQDDGAIVRLLTATDRVGINTSLPTESLSIIGTINITNNAGTLGLFQDGNARVGIGTASPVSTLDVRGNINATGFVNATTLQLVTGGTLLLPNNIVTSAMVADTLGIGIDSPQQELEVVGDINATSVIFTGAGSVSAPSFAFSRDSNTGLFNIGADQIAFATGGSTAMTINGSSVGIGTTSPGSLLNLVAAGANPEIRIQSFDTTPILSVRTARGTVASPTISLNGDEALRLTGMGYDGAAYQNMAQIGFVVDGASGVSDMPGRIVFHTSADGSATLTERMRIDGNGAVGINTTAPQALLHINTSANTNPFRITSASSASTFIVDSSGNVGIGTTGPQQTLEVVGTLNATGRTFLNGSTSIRGVAYTWPSADGSVNQTLTTNGAGVLSWAATTQNRSIMLPAGVFTASEGAPTITNGTSTVNLSAAQRWLLDRSGSGIKSVTASVFVPNDWDSGGFTLTIYWTNEGTGGGNAFWGRRIFEVVDGSSTVTSLLNAENSITAPTQYVLKKTTAAVSTAPSGAGSLLFIRITREAPSDNLNNAVGLLAVELQYTSKQ